MLSSRPAGGAARVRRSADTSLATSALEAALKLVTYTHESKSPDTSQRAITFIVANADGDVSQPAVTVVTITGARRLVLCSFPVWPAMR